jgi:acyl transferase domain-containing protein
MAEDIDRFWTNLEFARDCVVEVPGDRWDHEELSAASGGELYCGWGGFLSDVDRFDAAHFRISPREAKFMDPQERLFLETAAACLADAGYGPARLHPADPGDRRASVGVFVGATFNNYQLHQLGSEVPVNSQTYSIANRVSYVFDLKGPSLCLDTACSSSLVALHLACQSLLGGECETALAGGVNLSLHPSKYLSLCTARFASHDGNCRTFGADGDGYVPGEGVGAVLLKPLERAEADGDHIHAVIRGTAVNNDGRTFGYSVPNPTAQAEVVRAALERAGVDARTISYVEAHGTGTKLGDPVEVSGLSEAFRADTGDTGFCAIGSVKSGIGHLEAAAGIAALTKVLLQLRHRTIAASLLHAERTNPAIDFPSTPFVVQRATGPWHRPVVAGREVPRRAGISSFGAGGVNAHVVVEEYEPAPRPGSAGAGPEAVVLSARDDDRLRAYAGALRDRLAAGADGLRLADVAHTLQVGREEQPVRLAFAAASVREAADALGRFLREDADGGPALYTGTAGPGADEYPPGPPRPQEGPAEHAARSWAEGAAVDWAALRGRGPAPHVVPLPTCPFRGERYWPGDPRQTAPAPHRPAPRPAAPRPAPAARPVVASGLLAELVEAPPAERADVLTAHLRALLAGLLDYPPQQLPEPRQGFFDLGMESVMVEKFRSALAGELQVGIDDAAVFAHPTIEDLTAHLLELVPWRELEERGPSGPTFDDASSEVRTADDAEDPGLRQVADELRELLVELGEIR